MLSSIHDLSEAMYLPIPLSTDQLLVRVFEAALRAWERGDISLAWQLLSRALDRAEAQHDRAAALQAHQLLGHVALGQGNLEQARRHHREALQGSHAVGLQIGVASSLHNLGLVAACSGDQRRARALVNAAISAYTRNNLPEAAARARANLERLEVQ